ncbi:MAG: hypothetical protein NTV01_07530, partial [Bacteroidia bacterium]|nr:hypothetical protein [Bacteroidia bacterium]
QALSGAINYEAAVRRASENYQKIQIQVKDFTDHQSIDEFGRPNYLQDLEVLSAKIEIEKDRLNSDSLPADTFQQYHGRYKSLNDTVLLLRTACLKFKLSKSNQGNVADSLNRIQKGDSLRNLVRNPYEPIIPPQGDTLNQNVRDQKPIAVETPWYMSNRLIWTGLLAILILVFVSAIWSSARNKKILKERLTFLENGNAVNQQGKSLITGIFTNEVPDEYFTVNYQETIPESVVGKVHYHNSSIKSVYQLVHAALLERKGGDFGGYFFGNQYKLSGKGAVKSEIFIEKVCDSKYLRSSISNDISARADLIEELDELVSQNRKYRLIGWFTSSTDNSLEIPEGLMKIHRSFFKEKWQIGILLNPGSDVLQGAGFLRRKSGYLDPMPDPASFVKWDELYRFALNPTNSSRNDPERQNRNDKDYSRIALNNTWGDSVVTAVNFNLPVVGEITTAAASQAIPRDSFQVVGYLYGKAEVRPGSDGKTNEYEVFVDRFIELSNELTPRELPGFSLIGWWGQANVDVMNYLQQAVDYHEQSFREAYQISCLVNPSTGELRIFSRKHSLEMNNSTIETEEYSLKGLLSL